MECKTINTTFFTWIISLSCWMNTVNSTWAQQGVASGMLTSELKTITSENGETLEVESGTLIVPENRSKDNGRTISIAYYRLKSKAKIPASPIFLLAGGPGSSWINSFPKEERFREVTFYRSFADVVIFDQRGAGKSEPNLKCKGRKRLSMDHPLTHAAMRPIFRELSKECKEYWEQQGVDLSAYNTNESAADVNDLRKAFGYTKISLVGGSYGSHLGLHILRKYPDLIDRAIFYGIEGPNHTWDIPSEKLETLQRIAKEIETSDYYQNRIPKGGLITALRTVLERLEKEPTSVTLNRGNEKIEVEVNQLVVQAVATYKAGKRSQPEVWPDLILAMYNGDLTIPAKMAMGMRSIPAPNAMSNAMDFASGISEERYKRIQDDPAQSILGDVNLGYTLSEGLWAVPDLGDSFRNNVVSNVPVLLVHGTWDLSTPIENAREVLTSLKQGHLIEVIGGNHGALYNLYEHWPPIHDLVRGFMKGRVVEFPDEVTLGPLKFPEPSSQVQKKLWDAAKSGDVEAARKAIVDGADINALDTRRSRSGRRPLNWAAYYNNIEVLKLLLEKGADINTANLTGFTPIHHAVENNAKESVIILIEAGADINIPNKRGIKPIDTAKEKGYESMVKLLK